MHKTATSYKLFDNYPDILSVSQLQKALGIGRSKAYDLVHAGDIKCFYIGDSIKIPKTSLFTYIEDNSKSCYNATCSSQTNSGCQEGVYLL